MIAGLTLLLQLAAPAKQSRPVLSFPEPGMDDTAAYQGYVTRFYRDFAGNTVQIYVDGRSGRVVHLLADADNESIGFTVRDAAGSPAPIRWGAQDAGVSRSGGRRILEYRLAADAPHVYIGWLLLGSMRVERDLQYSGRHRNAFSDAPFVPQELERLVTALGRLDPAVRRQHLALLGVSNTEALRRRLSPTVTARRTASSWVARVIQPSLDARDTLLLELQEFRRGVMIGRDEILAHFRLPAALLLPAGLAFWVCGHIHLKHPYMRKIKNARAAW